MKTFLNIQALLPGGNKKNGSIIMLCRFLFAMIICLGTLESQSQRIKGTLQLADEYFAAGEFYTAANLYDQFLHPPKNKKTISEFPLNAKGRRMGSNNNAGSRTNIIFKQAESYRLANYLVQAAASYEECIKTDPEKYVDAIYWKAVCDRALGNYAMAEQNFKKFLGIAAINNPYKTAAENELLTLQNIIAQLARPDSILFNVQKLDAPGSSEKGLFSPAPAGNNKFLISTTQQDSVQTNGINPYHSRLFFASLNNGRLENMVPVNLAGEEKIINQGAASLSANGNYLYFTQWKKEKGQSVSAIYFSTKQGDGWSSPKPLTSVNLNGYNSKQPFCSADGKYIYFSADHPGGAGKFDIWYAPLNNDGTAGNPVNAGAIINTPGDEQAPFYQNSSSTLVYSSNGLAGMGGYDLFSVEGSELKWGTPENMGHPVNSSRDDIYFFAQEGTTLLSNAMVSSDRGSGCCLETYLITKLPKNKTLTGSIFNCKSNTPISGASITLQDVSGKTWQTTTGENGKYSFDLGKETYQQLKLAITKDLYIDTLINVKTASINIEDLLTDIITSEAVCIEKKPEPVLIIKAENVVTIFFDFDKSNLKPEATNKLDSIYNVLIEYPSATIQISGYTDGRGTEAYNKVLSDKRARESGEYLIKKGIDTKRITYESFGACCPIEMEIINGRDNEAGRSKNRRALINVNKE